MTDGSILAAGKSAGARGRSGPLASRLAASSAMLALLLGAAARAQSPSVGRSEDKFHITAQEKAACSSDAIRFCMHTYPDEDLLLACMKQNRDALTATCRVAFDAGLRRRRL